MPLLDPAVPRLDLNLGLARKILALMGYPSPEKLAEEAAKAQARAYVIGRMSANLKRINRQMKADGKRLENTPEAEWVRDAIFRLWRGVLDFKGGGELADLIRDSHDDKVLLEVAEPIHPQMKETDALLLVAQATVGLLF